jgi:putative transposase
VRKATKAIRGSPQIFNTDQGSQFTSFAFTNTLREAGIRISMDGRGRWIGYYNTDRQHSTFGGRTPDEVYAMQENKEKLAA